MKIEDVKTLGGEPNEFFKLFNLHVKSDTRMQLGNARRSIITL